MFLAYLTLITALTISGVAIFYSVSGLAAIFSAAVIPIIIMGGVLEVSKLVTAVWLHKYWQLATWWLKIYLSIAVLVLMLITSIGIFGFLSKAHDTASGNATEAIAAVQRIDGQIAREENRIEILEDRISGVSSGTGFDVSTSLEQQQEIIAGARSAVQADIDYNQTQITAINERLNRDLEALETSRTADVKVQTDQRDQLDAQVESYSSQGTTTIETDGGGFFRGATVENIDNVAKGSELRESQREDRAAIAAAIQRTDQVARERESELRREASVATREAQANINKYRAQTQATVDNATEEINRLREQSNSSQDADLSKLDSWNIQIDNIYTVIDGLKGEKFESEQAVRLVESEVGPIRYIAEFFTGTDEADSSLLETAVSWLIMVIIFVFDPLAVLLLIASQYTFEHRRLEKSPVLTTAQPEDSEIYYPSEPEPDPQEEAPDPQEEAPDLEHSELSDEFWEKELRLNKDLPDAFEPFEFEPDYLIELPEVTADSVDIVTSGVTTEKKESTSDYMLDAEGRSIHKDALKSLHPELFLAANSERASNTQFGITFPATAKKGDIFVRVDVNPNRVYKFEGNKWIEVKKESSDAYLYNEEYLKHLVSKIETGEYDVDLLSDAEKVQIEEYLNSIQ